MDQDPWIFVMFSLERHPTGHQDSSGFTGLLTVLAIFLFSPWIINLALGQACDSPV